MKKLTISLTLAALFTLHAYSMETKLEIKKELKLLKSSLDEYKMYVTHIDGLEFYTKVSNFLEESKNIQLKNKEFIPLKRFLNNKCKTFVKNTHDFKFYMRVSSFLEKFKK